MKRLRIICAIMACLSVELARAQDVFDHEVITMFEEGTVEMPLGSQTAAINDVIFDPSVLKTILLDHTAETISIAFPDYSPADSLIESPRFPGLSARQARLDLIFRIRLTYPEQRDSLNAKLKAYPEVYFSDKNGTADVLFEPDDPEFYRQWGMHSDEDNVGVPDADIDAPEAWDLEQGSSDAVIGIIDEGVYQGHIEFQGRISGEGPGASDHGTHVAGIAAAEGNNNEGIAGVTWNSQIYSKDISGFDAIDIYESVIDAITNGGADVLNNSWGGPYFNSVIHQALAIAHELGVLVVAARGNYENDDPFYPAADPDGFVLSVGAFNHDGNKSDFSSYGSGMDLLAPGGNRSGPPGRDIYSTYGRTGNQYAYLRGTSMAAPHVSGMVGLLDFYNQLPPYGDNFAAVICSTADDIYSDGYDDLSGYGRLNARAALDFISRPNRIYTCDAAGGTPYVVDPDPPVQSWYFLGTRVLTDHIYFAKQYEVRYDANYLACDCQPPLIDPLNETPATWGLDPWTHGWSGANPNGGVRWADVVNSDEMGLTLRTFVYEVWAVNGAYLGFFPNPASECTFSFSMLADGTPQPPTNLTVCPSPDYHPLISWDPSPTSNVYAHKVYRMVHGIEEDWVHIATVPVGNNQYEDTEYSTPHPGPYATWKDDADYTATAVNTYGESDMAPFVTITVVVPARPYPTPSKQAAAVEEIPEDFALSPAYPNPFNALTSIKYALPEDSYVKIEIFNVSGQKIKTLLSEYRPAGYHEVVWDASDISSGIYIYRIEAADFEETKSMTLLK